MTGFQKQGWMMTKDCNLAGFWLLGSKTKSPAVNPILHFSGFLGILPDQCQRTFEETPTDIWSSSSRGGLGAFLAEDRSISIMNPLSPASYLQTFSYKWLPWLLRFWMVCIFLFSIVNHQEWFPDMWIFFSLNLNQYLWCVFFVKHNFLDV